MKKLTVLAFLILIYCLNSWAKVEVLQFENVEQEQRYQLLIKELRCLVCQNQNLADSNADLAKDLREKTYQMIITGSSNEEIITYMVDRYGDFVLYRPPVKSGTLLLWAGPFILLLAVLLVVVLKVKKTRSIEAPEAADLDQARDLLSQSSAKKGDES